MIKDARAQAGLIAELHLDGLFKMGCLENAGDQIKRVTRCVTAIPHSAEYDSLQRSIGQLSQSLFRVRQLFSLNSRRNPFPPALGVTCRTLS